MLANTESEKTPLQKQLDGLSKIIASIAGIALVLVVVLGLLRDESFETLFVTGRHARGRRDPHRPARGRHGAVVDRHAGRSRRATPS